MFKWCWGKISTSKCLINAIGHQQQWCRLQRISRYIRARVWCTWWKWRCSKSKEPMHHILRRKSKEKLEHVSTRKICTNQRLKKWFGQDELGGMNIHTNHKLLSCCICHISFHLVLGLKKLWVCCNGCPKQLRENWMLLLWSKDVQQSKTNLIFLLFAPNEKTHQANGSGSWAFQNWKQQVAREQEFINQVGMSQISKRSIGMKRLGKIQKHLSKHVI